MSGRAVAVAARPVMPFFAAIRVDEVWSVLGHEDLGANCFPSMHTSVAFAILLLAQREHARGLPRQREAGIPATAGIFGVDFVNHSV